MYGLSYAWFGNFNNLQAASIQMDFADTRRALAASFTAFQTGNGMAWRVIFTDPPVCATVFVGSLLTTNRVCAELRSSASAISRKCYLFRL